MYQATPDETLLFEATQPNSMTDQLVKTAVQTADATALDEPVTAPEEDENDGTYIGIHHPAPLNKLIGQEFVAMRGMA